MEVRKTNLFILAPMRSGTTSLFNYLGVYKDIFPLPIKESHFFTNPWPEAYYPSPGRKEIDGYFERKELKPTHVLKIHEEKHYSRLISLAANTPYIMDASTSYLHAPATPEAILHYNPIAKRVVLLRDPLARTYSHYGMYVGLGKEKRSFEEAMRSELYAYKEKQQQWYGYLGMSLYDKAFSRHLAAGKALFVLTTSMLSNEDVLKQLHNFLDVPYEPEIAVPKLNTGREFLFQDGYNWAARSGVKKSAAKIVPGRIRRSAYKLFSKDRPSALNQVSDEILHELNDIFQKESKVYFQGPSGLVSK